MKKLLLIAGMCFALASAVFGQGNDQLPPAKEIVENYFEAIGGKEKLKEVKTWILSGNMLMNKTLAPLKIYLKEKKIRVEILSFGQQMIIATNGETAWEVNPYRRDKLIVKEGDDKENELHFQNLVFPAQLIKTSVYSRLKVSHTIFDGKAAYKLAYNTSGMIFNSESYIFDKSSYLLLQHNMKGMTINLKNYQVHSNGMKIPQSIKPEATKGPQAMLPMVFNKVQVDVAIADQIFEVPKVDPPSQNDTYKKLSTKGETLPADKNRSGNQIVAAYVKQHAQLAKVKTFIIQGKMKIGQAAFELTWYSKHEKARLEMTIQKTKIVHASNGRVSWQWNPLKSDDPIIIEGSKLQIAPINFVDKKLYSSKKEGLRIDYISKEYVGTQLCHRIKVFFDEKTSLNYYIGVSDSLLYKTLDEANELMTLMTNYKSIQRYKVAALMFLGVSENQSTTFEFDKITFNSPIDDNIFEFPGKKIIPKKTDRKD